MTIGARTVNQRARDRVSALILAGALGLGERLDERLLAERMGISRTPLREAVAQLAAAGIVEHRPYQGNFVRTFTRKQVHDLYEVRKALEALAIYLACPNLPGAGLARLSDIVIRCRAALDADDMVGFEQTDREFHAAIVDFADNETLSDGLRRLDLHVQLIRHLANQVPELPEHSMHERETILAALERGDAERAAEGMRQHIQRVQDAMLDQLPDDEALDPQTAGAADVVAF